MDPNLVFKAYDIRGRTDTGELDSELYRRVGVALVAVLGFGKVAIGRDCRPTSKDFFEALAGGVMAAGGDVIDVGEVPTDAIYFYSGAFDVPGAMITASHNPTEYNGLKVCRSGAAPVGLDSGLSDVKRAVIDFEEPGGTKGSIEHTLIVDAYLDHLFRIVPPDGIAQLDVAVDAGNGMAGVALDQVFVRIAPTLTGLYLEPDGTFPNHPADPLVAENLEDLRQLMSTRPFDLGVAFDGDADRAFFMDDTGEPLSGSTVTSLIARRMLQDHPQAAVVHNLITSKAVPEIVSEAGGKPIRTRVGHSFIKQVMADSGAVFGGEHSGHYYFRDNFRADSGMLAMLSLLRVLSEDGRPLSVLRSDVERYVPSGEINFVVADVAAVVAEVETVFSEARIDHLDGLTVDFGECWFNLRPSNTEPLLRLNAEAATSGEVDELVRKVTEIVEQET